MAVTMAKIGGADYWRTPRRGFINLSTGGFEQYPDIGPQGGPPYRGETDAEFEARLAKHDEES